MGSRKLPHQEWQNYFDSFSKTHGAALINLEVVGKDIGDQTEIRWQPLRGLSHDPHKDSFFVVTDSLEHTIFHPKTIHIEELHGVLRSIEIVDQDNNHQIIRLKDTPKSEASK